MVRKLAEKGVKRSDAGSLPSRRRLSTGGAAVPLPIVRLPERFGPERTSVERFESRSISNGFLQPVK
jgi:hypothetical protein